MIHEHLQRGVENAQSATELCALLGMERRELSAAVERERRAHIPICATTRGKRRGYYLAADKEEMRRYCSSLLHRAGEIHKTRRACMAAMDSLPGE